MTGEVYLNMAVDTDSLVMSLIQLDTEDLFKLFKDVDDMLAEYEFTERLANHFKAVIDKENE